MNEKKKNNPLLAALKPLARQYVSSENISKVFDNIVAGADIQPDEKPAIIISRSPDGTVAGALYGINGTSISSQYSDRFPLDQLILNLLA